MNSIDLTGQRFGKWLVLEKANRPPTNSRSKPLYWRCKCACGNESIIPSHNLRCKRTTNCGCETALPAFRYLYNLFLALNEGRVECNLKFEEFLEFTSITKCHYCNAQINWVKHGGKSAYYLDRKDNDKGYSKSNCVVCCPRCNFGKSSRFTYDEWYGMTKYFRDRQNIAD